MDAIIANPKTPAEFKLLSELLKKMRISSRILSDEEKEEIGSLKLMQQADRTDKVSKSQVMAKLTRK